MSEYSELGNGDMKFIIYFQSFISQNDFEYFQSK